MAADIVLDHVFAGSLHHHFAAIHHHESIGEIAGELEILLDQQDRHVAALAEIIDRAARLLADADDLFRERNRGADPYAGLLRIGLFPGSMDWLINDAAIGLLKRHEGVRLEIVSGNSERAVQLLSRGDIDVAFCHRIGLDYVSCSPYRVPIARLAAAQAALEEKEG